MFLKGLLFGLGLAIGSGIASCALIGTIALLEWAGGRRNKHSKRPATDHGLDRDLIVHARSLILRLERMLDLLQNQDWERGSAESNPLQTYTIQ
jgi:hypothetical protein